MNTIQIGDEVSVRLSSPDGRMIVIAQSGSGFSNPHLTPPVYISIDLIPELIRALHVAQDEAEKGREG